MTFWELPCWAETKAKRDKLRQEMETLIVDEKIPVQQTIMEDAPTRKDGVRYEATNTSSATNGKK